MLKIGEMTVHLINDVTYRVDVGGAFGLVPRSLYARYFQPDADNLIPMVQLCLLVQTADKNILIDTGYGDKVPDRMRRILHWQDHNGLPRGLAELGITPEQIDLVINTHLHGDHCGGNTRYAGDAATIEPVFPNAEYVVQRREYEDATHPNERTRATYLAENFQGLADTGQMRLLDGDTELLPGIWGLVTPGHTPGHMSVRLESGGEAAAFVCDLASYAVHYERLAWMTAYDVEPLVTLETKRTWQQWAIETGATLIFVHDPKRPVGRLVMDGKSPALEPLDVPIFNLDPADYADA